MNNLVISLTGFNTDQREQSYIKYIQNLNCSYAPKLRDDVSVLVVNHTATEKYKIARLSKNPIYCVSRDWLEESHQRKRILPCQNYSISKIFSGVKVAVLDFSIEKSNKLKSIIETNGGIVMIFDSLNKLNQILNKDCDLHVIVTTKAQFNRFRKPSHEIQIPIVEIEWVEQSVRSKMCKFPQDYAMNQNEIGQKSLGNHFTKIQKKLQDCLAVQLNNLPESNYLSDTLIYIAAETMDAKLVKVFKKMIMACGGMYLDIINPALTHILAGPVTEEEHMEFKKYGTLTFVLRVQWLLDSIYLSKRMGEQDYVIRSYKAKVSPVQLQLQRSASQRGELPSLVRMDSRTSISAPYVKDPIDNLKKKLKSFIFKDKNFFVDKSLKKDNDYADIIKKIRQNGGAVYDSLTRSLGRCFAPLKDGPQIRETIEKTRAKYTGFIPVSLRWINECINKKMFIELNETSYIFRPFQFRTPLVDFHKFVIDIIGEDEVRRRKLKEMISVLGSHKMVPNRSELTHCLCGQKYKESPKLKDIRRDNSTVQFVRLEWLQDCLKEGKTVPIQCFLIDLESDSEKTHSPVRTNQSL